MMLTEEQEQIIIQYLLQKRLSLDIAAEIFDHMSSQIIHLQEDEKLSFEEAWMRTKSSWLQDLKMSFDAVYGFDDVSEIMKTVTKKRWKQDVMTVLPSVLGLTFLLNLIFMNLSLVGVNYFRICFGIVYAAFVIVTVVLFRKRYILFKKYSENQMISGMNWSAMVASTAGIVSIIYRYDSWVNFHEAFKAIVNSQWETKAIMTILFFNFMMIIFSFLLILNILYQRKLKKTITQIKPFLEKLK